MKTNLWQSVSSIFVFVILIGSIFNCDIPETPINEEEFSVENYDLSLIKRIALLTFVGRSSSCPSDTLHHDLTRKMWNKFESLMNTDSTIEFIPMNQIINDESYKLAATTTLPSGAYSPIKGLTYIKYGTEGGFDCEPLLTSLHADAALLIIVIWGNSVRNNGTSPYVKAVVESGLIVPPERPVWQLSGQSKYYEEQIRISIINDPILMLSIGVKWVLFTPPSEEEYAKLTRYALNKDTKIADEVATGLFYGLLRGLNKSLSQ
ncbi:MAG: hypothetical protein JXI43_09490 [Tissierellales bacterium]|nr:hypothetical protein [Tissierellales bacterium]